MATNLNLDEDLIAQAVKAGRHRTKREAVHAALREYVRAHKRFGIIGMFGKVDYRPEYDYRAERGKKR